MSYDAFISYSHAADGLLAPRLQAGLQRFAKPWWKRRAIRVFRDESSLSANPHLWSSITDALDESEWFVLLLSPEAAQSEWVGRELEHWKQHKDPARILPVVTAGTFGWDNGDVAGDAVPPALSGAFTEEPRWVDLRFARTETQLDLNNPTFSAAIADIASAVRGIPKDQLESEEVKQHRRTRRTAWVAGIAIAVLAAVALVLASSASNERDRTLANLRISQANEVLADDPELAIMLALESGRHVDAPLGDALDVLHSAMPLFTIEGVGEYADGVGKAQATAADLSPDGRTLAITEDGLVVSFVDVASLEVTHRIGEQDDLDVGPLTGFPHMSWSPDGTSVATVDPFGRVLVRRADSGEIVFRSEAPDDAEASGSALFSPRGHRLVAGGATFLDGSLAYDIIDTSTWETVSTVKIGGTSVAGLTISEDGKYLITGSWAFPAEEAVLRVWDLTTGVLVRERGAPASLGAVAVDASNSLIAANDLTGVITLYDFGSLEPVRHLHGHVSTVAGMQFSPDGTRLASSGRRLIIWNVETGAQLNSLNPGGEALNVNAGWTTAYLAGDNRVEAWSIGPVTQGELTNISGAGLVQALDVSVGSDALAAFTDLDGERSLVVWDLPVGKTRFVVDGLSGFSQGAAFQPDGQHVVVQLEEQGDVLVLDAYTGEHVADLEDGPGVERYAFAFSAFADAGTGGITFGAT